MLQKKEAIARINAYGKAKIPFLFVIDFMGENNLVIPQSDIDAAELLYVVGSHSNATQSKDFQSKELLKFSKKAIAFDSYKQAFEKVKMQLDFGNTYLTNLTQPTPIELNRSLKEVFYQSKAPYKLWFKEQMVVFSPEIFVQVSSGKIASYPMKGTIDANAPDAERKILTDPKETAEHNTIVDLIRNDLSMISKNVRVEQFRYIDRIKTNQKELLQVSSKIVGDVPDTFFDCLGTNLFTLLPAGSISGAPKKKTVEIIRDAEGYERGFYTGVFGFFDGKSLDSAVMIRYIESRNGKYVFKSGGGITTFSELEKEYQELIDKVYVPIY